MKQQLLVVRVPSLSSSLKLTKSPYFRSSYSTFNITRHSRFSSIITRNFSDSRETLFIQLSKVKKKDKPRAIFVKALEDITEFTEKVASNKNVIDGLRVSLYDHQVEGLRFMLKREFDSTYKSGFLCDERGLGRQIQMLSLIIANPAPHNFESEPILHVNQKTIDKIAYNKRIKSTLLVANTRGNALNWKENIVENTNLTVILLHRHPSTISVSPELLSKFDIVVTTYEYITLENNIKGKTSPFYLVFWWRIIFDHCESLREAYSNRTTACFNLSGNRRWGMTYNPMSNHLGDIRSTFRALQNFDYKKVFACELQLEKFYFYDQYHLILDALRIRIGHYMLRRTKSSLTPEALSVINPVKVVEPKLKLHDIEVEFYPFERAIYSHLENRIIVALNKKYGTEQIDRGNYLNFFFSEISTKDNSIDALDISPESLVSDYGNQRGFFYSLFRLRQAVSHWKMFSYRENDYLLDSGNDKIEPASVPDDELYRILDAINYKYDRKELENHPPSAKIQKLVNLLKTEHDRPTIVFFQFIQLCDLVEQELVKNGIEYERYDRSDRYSAAINSTIQKKVVLCTFGFSHGLGFKSVPFSRVIFIDPYWNRDFENKIVERIKKEGNVNSIDIYTLIINNTVESALRQTQKQKDSFLAAILDGKKINQNEISGRNLLTFLNNPHFVRKIHRKQTALKKGTKAKELSTPKTDQSQE
ncbi:uncharacterized protein ASCRUDRAFT_6029 [Ascoidea rubescens DSM 1968]|uniref:SNF2 N-terminal domain-containing protein n=1 Tax=Ascoidea rubescens DSM 1968 TaxID=1344418 RepID=A0A1D2VRC8_9ASCO|nr:hypothetical protein ASCRUDRAFT_6029 [Ascoidea rubescens DSM 1968]ODV64161.1 hypothetical protein ASCRUDRAFT_6029 [Ascoidea rubescens DSM 1968]